MIHIPTLSITYKKKYPCPIEFKKILRLMMWKFDYVRNDLDEQECQAKEMTN